MLRELFIRNFAVVDELRGEFARGLNILTGETGAGKSILIDALGLALGARPAEEQIRTGADEAIVEAAFEAGPGPALAAVLEAEGIGGSADEFLVLRRHVLRGGRSKAYVNGHFSSAGTLRALGTLLVDIHGQHEGQALLEPRRHRELLDAFAGLTEEVQAFRTLYGRAQDLRRQLEGLRAADREKAQRMDLLEFQRREIEGARLFEGEEEALLGERAVLANAERLFAAADEAYGTLYGEEGAVTDRLAGVLTRLRDAVRIDPRLAPSVEACEAAAALLEDAARSLRDYREGIAFDPARLEEVESRLHEIGKLKRKYGATVAEILAHGVAVAAELETLNRAEERAAGIERELGALEADLARRAAKLSEARRAAARDLERRVVEELKELGMPRAAFRVGVSPRAAGPAGLGATGGDEVEFFVSLNPGEELKPLHRVASGGELSRIMLALKAILAAVDQVSTLIFDEVDAGIGGSMAEVVGRKLASVAAHRQILCITHLPQIASFADHHLSVTKREVRDRMTTALESLMGEEQVSEVARLLGGKGKSDISVQHAREILAAAHRWKKRKD